MKRKLVVDANEFFSCVITKGKEHQSWALDAMFSDNFELFAPSESGSEQETFIY